MRARKRDDNERQIVDSLRAIGASVERLDGSGVPDLLVAFRGRLYLLEVKDPVKLDGKGHRRSGSRWPELTDTQVRWWTSWDASAMPVIVRSIEDALQAIGASTRLER